MLSVEDNEILCRVGPGTIMGDFLREYWVPALISSELPAPDCPPVRLRLLGENLVAFRATSGLVGVLEDACPHRNASLFFGRNEDNGIRCVYHGWKFDVTGQCVDQMSEPAYSNYKDKVKAKAYPVNERGGVIWVYMGPRETPPALPDLEANMMPEGRGSVRAFMVDWNWFQVHENGLDTSHQGILHFGAIPYEDAINPEKSREAYPGPVEDLPYIVSDRAPVFEVIDTEYGLSYDASRKTGDGRVYHRLMHWGWPWYVFGPVQKLGTSQYAFVRVPIDDTHTMVWNISTGRLDPSADAERYSRNRTSNVDSAGNTLVPNTPDWFGRFRPTWLEEARANDKWDFGIDREVQRTSKTMTGFTGLPTVAAQDGMATWSQGPISDRSREHLGTSDSAIIRCRRLILEAAKNLRENGATPPGVDTPEVYRQRSGWIVLPDGVNVWEATRHMREAYKGLETAPAPYTPPPEFGELEKALA